MLEIERLHITIANLTAKSTNNETEKSPVTLRSVQQENLHFKNENKKGDEGSIYNIINWKKKNSLQQLYKRINVANK